VEMRLLNTHMLPRARTEFVTLSSQSQFSLSSME